MNKQNANLLVELSATEKRTVNGGWIIPCPVPGYQILRFARWIASRFR